MEITSEQRELLVKWGYKGVGVAGVVLPANHWLYACHSRECRSERQLLSAIPFVKTASCIVARCINGFSEINIGPWVSASVVLELHEILLVQVSKLITAPLIAVFNESRVQSGHECFSADSSDLHDEFEHSVIGNMRAFLDRFPPLGRIVATHCEQFVRNHNTMIERFQNDRSVLISEFGLAANLVGLEVGLSDPHNGQQSVVILEFETGEKLVYKPRDVSAEAALCSAIEFTSKQLAATMRSPRVLPRDGYGWCEYIVPATSVDSNSVCGYAINAGRILGVAHVLAMTDCHFENVITTLACPVLVDAETICTSRAVPIDWPKTEYTDSSSTEFINDSVVRTGLVPRWDVDGDRQFAIDVSGLCGNPIYGSGKSLPIVLHANSDAVRIVLSEEKPAVSGDSPIAVRGGCKVDLVDHVDLVEQGFRQIYLMFQNLTPRLRSDFLQLLESCHTRFVFRNTWVYWAVMNESRKGSRLRCVEKWESTLLMLAKPFLECDVRPHSFNVLLEEIEQIASGDIPYFATRTDSRHLYRLCGSIVSEDFLEETGLQKVDRRLKGLTDTGLETELAIIRGAFLARRSAVGVATEDGVAIEFAERADQMGSLDFEENISHVNELARCFRASTHWAKNGVPEFISFSYVPSVGRFQLSTMGWSLYDGKLGVMLAIACCDTVSQKPENAELIFGILRGLAICVERKTTRTSRAIVDEIGIGGFSGVGSVLYAMCALCRVTDDWRKECEEISNILLDRIPFEVIENDTVFDFFGGVAGLASSLLASYEEFRLPKALELARLCGERLIEGSVHTPIGGRAWENKFGLPLSGLSHGAAGMCLSLCRLYKVIGDRRLVEIAKEAQRFEDAVFSCDFGNWRDLRRVNDWGGLHEASGFQSTWCHGAPGILLSRGECTRLLPEFFSIDDTFRAGVASLAGYGGGSLDHLCCGEAGVSLILSYLSSLMADPSLAELGRRRLNTVRLHGTQRGGYRLLQGVKANLLHLGFFQGISGMACALSNSSLATDVLLLR